MCAGVVVVVAGDSMIDVLLCSVSRVLVMGLLFVVVGVDGVLLLGRDCHCCVVAGPLLFVRRAVIVSRCVRCCHNAVLILCDCHVTVTSFMMLIRH